VWKFVRAALLRVELVERDGQFYWSDESLCLRARDMLHAIESGDGQLMDACS
jgi:hypothetical protein